MRPLIITTLLVLAALAAFPPSSAAAAEWRWPVHGEVITPYRNGDNPYASGQHRGIDITAPVGTAVEAATGGTVTFAGRAGSSGLTVNVRTDDGTLDLSYLHLSSLETREGERVEAGQRLGAVGTTGTRSAEQPHLHLGVREAGSRHAYRDPLDFLPPPGRPAPRPDPPALPVEVPLLPPLPVPLAVPTGAPGAVPVPAAPPLAEPRAAPQARPSPGPLGGTALGPLTSPAPSRVSAGAAPSRTGMPGHADEAPAGGSAPDGSAPRTPPPLSSRVARGSAAPPHGADTAAPQTPPEPSRRAGRGPDRGLNLAWLAACLGLIAVALALGRPAGPVEAARRARATLSALTRPLAGRG
jgi:hypothetical protein